MCHSTEMEVVCICVLCVVCCVCVVGFDGIVIRISLSALGGFLLDCF